MVHDLYLWMLAWAESPYASWALFILAFAESSFFPLPPDVLLMALTIGSPKDGWWFATVTTAGSVLGGIFGYSIGYFGGRPLLNRWISQDKVSRIHNAFQRYEVWAIGIAGFTPIPYKLFTISAGAFFINLPKFILVSALSRGGRFFLVAGTLQIFGPSLKKIIEDYFNIINILFVIVLISGFFIVRVLSRKHVEESQSSKPN